MMNIDQAVSIVKERRGDYSAIRADFYSEFPVAMKALKVIDCECREPKKRKGYNLVARENKKLGFVYYVRYYHDGRMLPSKWTAGTADREDAEKFALENKERLIEKYLHGHNGKAYELYENFFKKNSAYLEDRRSRRIAETTRSSYHSVIAKKFVPYMKELKVTAYDGVTVKMLRDFQDKLLLEGIKPQSVNDDLKAVRRVFAYLEFRGIIKENPCRNLKPLTVFDDDKKARGCHDAEAVKGVFNRNWADKASCLLCLLIYSTGMRNSEIKRIRLKDIIKTGKIRYIDIAESKTPNGIRRVPLHEFAYRKLAACALGKKEAERVFGNITNITFMKANKELGKRLGFDEPELKRQNITFYSGRHYWKTLMRSEGLGEAAEELFMGHKVSADMKKLYDHKDKQGQKQIAKKARQVFAILDKGLFGTAKKGQQFQNKGVKAQFMHPAGG